MTQSFEESPFTYRNVKKAKWQHILNASKKFDNSDNGPTKDGQLE